MSTGFPLSHEPDGEFKPKNSEACAYWKVLCSHEEQAGTAESERPRQVERSCRRLAYSTAGVSLVNVEFYGTTRTESEESMDHDRTAISLRRRWPDEVPIHRRKNRVDLEIRISFQELRKTPKEARLESPNIGTGNTIRVLSHDTAGGKMRSISPRVYLWTVGSALARRREVWGDGGIGASYFFGVYPTESDETGNLLGTIIWLDGYDRFQPNFNPM
ncbi:hypothetical protein B0H17DRAFT_1258059 [Mycena rosella]|uniref:Uncharacterized protein n=1 Tax=Mycena rosella TaxID=1033263 RepID=A0AAD7CU67_MYCRO|nr:hypothetical protein B0H17DRAFT_1258059 [Mycena rosella]